MKQKAPILPFLTKLRARSPTIPQNVTVQKDTSMQKMCAEVIIGLYLSVIVVVDFISFLDKRNNTEAVVKRCYWIALS